MMLLRPVEKIFHILVHAKNKMYDSRLLKPVKLPVPVVSVGNISFGGVGKTPCVIFLAEEFSKTHKVNVITKSYKADLTEPQEVDLKTKNAVRIFGDEACLIQSQLSKAKVWSGPDKSETATASLQTQPDLIFIDDGFSHRRLSRKFDLVLVDATQGFDTYLREPVTQLKRAHAVLITKVNLAGVRQIEEIKNRIESIAPHLKNSIFQSKVITKLDVEKTSPLFVFCGLGRPETFMQDLTLQGYQVVHQKCFADHHQYSADEQKSLYFDYVELQKKYDNLKLVTTEKDRVKITDEMLIKTLHVPAHSIEIVNSQKETLLEKIRLSF